MPSPKLALYRDRFPARPAYDVAVSRALLMRAADAGGPASLRLYRPDDVVVFGRQDAASEGFPDAVEAAAAHGFGSVIRLAGGRAAVFHSETIAFARTIPDTDPHSRTFARFEETSEIIASALRWIGVEAEVGEIPGEYCPGEFSVGARKEKKLVGIGQRIIRGAAHVGGVIVVSGAQRITEVLIDVYDALGLGWDPATSGSVDEETGSDWDDVHRTVGEAFDTAYDTEHAVIDPAVLEEARRLESDHQA